MKASNYLSKKLIVKGMLYFFPLFVTLNSYGQFLLKSNTNPPYLPTTFEEDNGNLKFGIGKLLIGNGFGFLDPNYAIIHSKSFLNFSSIPLYQTDLYSSSGVLQAGIKHLVRINGINYGIYQSSIQSPTTPVINYLQDPLIVGNVKISQGSDNNGIISLVYPFSKLDFIINPGDPTPDPVTALTINTNGIIVRSKVVTDRIQLLTNPGESKVLVSDREGNGSWLDASIFNDDDWLVTSRNTLVTESPSSEKRSLYFNHGKYQYVGIGTEDPGSLLHIVDGNILISRSDTKAPGSILFGEIWSLKTPNGNWGISYNNSVLNFWKPKNELGPEGNYYFLIHDNGNTGIGFNETTVPVPRSKLEIINNSMEKAGIIMNRVRSSINPDASMTNEIRFDIDDSETWAIGAYLGVEHPNSFYIWNELQRKTELFISEYGKIGLGTNDPKGKLELVNTDDNIDLGLILNQWSESNNRNLIQFQRKGARHWTIGEDYDNAGLFDFSIRSLWQPDNPSLYIQPNGMIGINTDQPHAMLEVNGTLEVVQGVGIGFHAPDPNSNWKLNVNGGIWAREVKVTVEAFPDYVFSKDYPLLTIADYQKFITENNHLPGLPSSAEVNENNGIELGKFQTKLVEKIEEQALYIISLQKQIDDLKAMILNQKSK